MPLPRSVFVPAYAKINWTLDVLGKREDGYHELRSVMQTIALCDTIRLTVDESGTPGAIRFTCDVPALRTEDNLAVRTAHLLRRLAGRDMPALRIELSKHIPVQAGLGGGSSDAATVLKTLNTLWNLRLGIHELERAAAELGSDVPFFVHGGTALIEGRGERVTPLPDAEPLWLVVVMPDVGISTPAVFQALTPDQYGHGPSSETITNAIRAGAQVPFEQLHNDLEPGVLRNFQEVARAHDDLRGAGADTVLMSGSGAALFAPFRELDDAARVHASVAATGLATWLTHTIAATAAIG